MTASARRVASHRARLQAKGLRPIQLWVPDTRAPGFAAEAERQARLADAGAEYATVMDWAEAAGAWDSDDPPR